MLAHWRLFVMHGSPEHSAPQWPRAAAAVSLTSTHRPQPQSPQSSPYLPQELTDIEEQRRIRRLIKNRATAQASRERKRQQLEDLQAQKEELLRENEALARLLSQRERECQVERERLRLALAKAMRGAIP